MKSKQKQIGVIGTLLSMSCVVLFSTLGSTTAAPIATNTPLPTSTSIRATATPIPKSTATPTQRPAIGNKVISGFAFIDANKNGKFDANEAIWAHGYYKLTDGGAWFTCGNVAPNGTYGVPVNSSGNYYMLPIAPAGYRTTTPMIKVNVGEVSATGVQMGFVPDASAPLDSCSQYTPPRATGDNIMVRLSHSGRFTILINALKVADLDGVLAGEGPYTLFAPTDDAFATLSAGKLDALLKNPAQLRAILMYHVVPAKKMSVEVNATKALPTLNSKAMPITLNNGVAMIGDAKIVGVDVPTTNGVIHVLDRVLMP